MNVVDDSNTKAPLKYYSKDDAGQPIQLAGFPNEKPSKVVPPLQNDIFTSRKHSMDYFTVDGVKLRTGYQNERDWYLIPIRETLDNAIDFLWKNYKGADNTSISVDITKDDKFFHVKIQNTNYKNVPVFPDLQSTFDFDIRYGSKQDVHIISRGQLGDALKQILSLGYVLIHIDDDGTAFIDKQWEYPLIIRHNKKERKVYLIVDKPEQKGRVRIDDSPEELSSADTEIELVLPIIEEVHDSLDKDYIEHFCRKYSLFTTDISFKFRIIDDTTYPEVDDDVDVDYTMAKLTDILSTTPKQGILNIDVPALHSISIEWNNADFIHSYKPEEFKNRIINVHNKQSISVYDVLSTWREGSNIKKTPDNEISIAELLSKSNNYKIIEGLYKRLKKVLDAPSELSLPYNTKKRKDVLVERISKLYPEIDTKKDSSYKLVRDVYNDGIICYPHAFEIIAIPLKEPYGPDDEWDKPKQHRFIGAVNYSISPKNNIFEGDYFHNEYVKDIISVLRVYYFKEYAAYKNKIPCLIVGNLITPRRDPHGYDKSSIDTQPFTNAIVYSVEKISKDIQTYRGAGYTFRGRDNEDISRRNIDREVSGRAQLIEFMQKNCGLPTVDKYGNSLK